MSFPHLQNLDVHKLAQQQQQQSTFSPQIVPTRPIQQAQQPQLPLQITTIKEVWNENFHHEFQIIRQLISEYNYVSFSTEFPGILARPIGVFASTNDYHYQTLRANADLLNLIQFGISLTDANGKKPDHIYSTWQFNFKFDLNSKMISNDSFESLIKTGIDFHKHQLLGIDQFEFAELLTSSGLVLLPEVHWSSFHTGYDVGFLISILTNNMMPVKEEEFLNKVEKFFPHLFDLKFLSKFVSKDSSGKSTLEQLSDELNIPRLNVFVTTGGQALLTSFCLLEIKNRVNDIERYSGIIHGLGSELSLIANNEI